MYKHFWSASDLSISLLHVVIQGIYRKPQQCKERHKALMERVGVEELENSEDPTSTQQQFAKVNVMHFLKY